MSKNLKCPICGGRLDLDCYDGVFGEEATFDCIPCGLTITGQRRFERIAAAMEYAKKTAYWFGLPVGVDHQEDARAEQAMQNAETRVIEVFK